MKKRQLIFIILGLFLTSLTMGFAPVQPVKADIEPIIVTVAGNGSPGYTGNGGAAADAQLYNPSAIAFDGQGNMYIADTTNNCVRKVDSKGIITTYAGCGIRGTEGDGGPAVLAQLMFPRALAFDRAGNLYIATSYNIRKVDAQGNISTVAGTGQYGFSGIGGPAASAEFFSISGLAVDSNDNLFIADTSRICKVNSKGIITIFAGTDDLGWTSMGGTAKAVAFYGAYGLAFDNNDNLYLADCYNNSIHKIDSKGIITTAAGVEMLFEGDYAGDGGPAAQARLNYPSGVAFDKTGNMYIADSANNCIRKVDSDGIISTVAGNGSRGFSGDGRPARLAFLSNPNAVAFDAGGNMYIADRANHCIRKVIMNETDMKNIKIVYNEIVVKIGSPTIQAGGEEKDIDPGYATVPEIKNDKTFAPIGTVVESLGGTVEWNEVEQKVTIKANNVEAVVQIGNTYSTLNGVYKKLDAKPYLSESGRAMLPLKSICQNLGYEVIWDDASQTVTIR